MKQINKFAIESVSTASLEKGWNKINSRINHIVRVNGKKIEQNNTWIKLLEYFYYLTY